VGQLKSNSIARLAPGKYGDGDGLWFRVKPSGRRIWSFRFMRHGRARELGLGPYPAVSLQEGGRKPSRCAATWPLAGKSARRASVSTFADASRAYIKAQSPAWRSPKHAAQWAATLDTYADPIIGHLPVDKIETAHVLAILSPIWSRANETASRVRGRIESILDAAKAQGLRSGDNPARWKGNLDKLLPKRSKTAPVRHHAALDFLETQDLFVKLAEVPGEALGAQWAEIDLENRVWAIPAARMKGGRPHRVPLTGEALAILGPRGDGFLFPGKGGRPLSNMAMAMVLRRQGVAATVHGFRSTFRDWAAASTDFPREVAEASLAHAIGGVEAAYRRGDLLRQRRKLMELWATMLGM
jgi:integrase